MASANVEPARNASLASTNTCWSRLLAASVVSMSSASRMGIPALRNAPICRLNTIRSCGLTFFGVSSICLKLLRSLKSATLRWRPSKSFRARIALGASSEPLMVAPLGSVATKLNFGISVRPRLVDVHAAEHFTDGGDVFLDHPQRLVLQGSHPLRGRELGQLVVGPLLDDEPFHRRRDAHQLVDADAVDETA